MFQNKDKQENVKDLLKSKVLDCVQKSVDKFPISYTFSKYFVIDLSITIKIDPSPLELAFTSFSQHLINAVAPCLICSRTDLYHDQFPLLGVSTEKQQQKSVVPQVHVIEIALPIILSVLGCLESTLEWNSPIFYSVPQKMASDCIEAELNVRKTSSESIFVLNCTLSLFSATRLGCHLFKTILQRSRKLHV